MEWAYQRTPQKHGAEQDRLKLEGDCMSWEGGKHQAPGFLQMAINCRESKEGWKLSKEKQQRGFRSWRQNSSYELLIFTTLSGKEKPPDMAWKVKRVKLLQLCIK